MSPCGTGSPPTPLQGGPELCLYGVSQAGPATSLCSFHHMENEDHKIQLTGCLEGHTHTGQMQRGNAWLISPGLGSLYLGLSGRDHCPHFIEEKAKPRFQGQIGDRRGTTAI